MQSVGSSSTVSVSGATLTIFMTPSDRGIGRPTRAG